MGKILSYQCIEEFLAKEKKINPQTFRLRISYQNKEKPISEMGIIDVVENNFIGWAKTDSIKYGIEGEFLIEKKMIKMNFVKTFGSLLIPVYCRLAKVNNQKKEGHYEGIWSETEEIPKFGIIFKNSVETIVVENEKEDKTKKLSNRITLDLS